MKLVFVILLLLAVTESKAQFVEKIYLKDSITTYTGWVVEQVPQEYLKILRQKERDTILINTDKIWKIVRVIDAKANNPFSTEQVTGRHQSIFLELGGSAFIYSLNYDTRFIRNKRDGWGIRAGIGYIDLDITDATNSITGYALFWSLPVQVNYLFGKKRSALELGVGATPLVANFTFYGLNNGSYVDFFDGPITAFYLAPTTTIGYRFTSLNNGVMFRISVHPAVQYGDFSLGAGLSLGYHFARKKDTVKNLN